MKRTTQYALAAALATTLMGSGAYAADLGGNCCADLEERIAELEATTVRKGNRRVTLAISGYVSHHVMFWDDGTQSDTYIGDGGNYGSRFRLRGEAKISADVTAGFLYEFASRANAIGSTNQFNGGDDLGNSGAPANSTLNYTGCTTNNFGYNEAGCIVNRQTVVYLQSKHLGTVKVGHGSTATDDLILIDLGGLTGAATPDVALYMGGFALRGNDGRFGSSAALNWTNAIRGFESFDTNRRNHVLYESPTLYGFNVQTAFAEDNFWDVALRYAGEFNGVRIAGGIGYSEDTKFNQTFQLFDQNGALCTTNCDVKAKDLKGSISALHVPTGLFLTFAAGNRELDGSQNGLAATQYTGPDNRFWWLSGGIARNFFGIGNTVLFGEYGEHKGGFAQQAFLGNISSTNGHCTVLNGVSTGGSTSNCDSKVTNWGIGIQQYVDAAAMEIFIAYKNFSFDGNGFVGTSGNLNNNVHDIQSVIIGTRIQF